MARVGFKKTYPAGAFNNAAVLDLFANIKNYVSNAGFNVQLNNSDAIDFIQAGSPAGTANDDSAHWAFECLDQGGTQVINANSVFGADYLAADARKGITGMLGSTWAGNPSPEISLWFACDGCAGWWYLHGVRVDTGYATGIALIFSFVGATSRRYPSDTHQGLCARYGLHNMNAGRWHPVYALRNDGVVIESPETLTWSPFGLDIVAPAKRHPGSPIPKMAVPRFPCLYMNATPCVLGEFNEVLTLTDGYVQEEMVIPGWVAMTGNGVSDRPYAVPAPASFTLL